MIPGLWFDCDVWDVIRLAAMYPTKWQHDMWVTLSCPVIAASWQGIGNNNAQLPQLLTCWQKHNSYREQHLTSILQSHTHFIFKPGKLSGNAEITIIYIHQRSPKNRWLGGLGWAADCTWLNLLAYIPFIQHWETEREFKKYLKKQNHNKIINPYTSTNRLDISQNTTGSFL